ncbi:hypothetical protein DSO57_1024958 [Entomophthora muscae]|uniref:Uncharacterized protein n=1 Tax=Entomophthora muscae TaxID=34485 RepID=A0ACC2S4P8_9FUNG|nr:hypothetical protein DSO57_1024958 [Entomophthora muscae]
MWGVGLWIALLATSSHANMFSEAFEAGLAKLKEGWDSLPSKSNGMLTSMYKEVKPNPTKLDGPKKEHGITKRKVQKYLQRSLISTCDWEKIASGECFCKKYTPVDRIYDAKADSAAVVAHTRKSLIVSFRPTQSKQNWMTNFNTLPVQLPSAEEGIKVHLGFLEYYKSLQPLLEEVVLKSLENRTLHLTGYSLGGAIAIVSLPSWARLLKEKNLPNKIQAFTYASPRVGNSRFAEEIERLDIPIARYTIRDDIVSQVPPRSLKYVHVGQEFFYNSTHLVRCRLDFDEDPECSYKIDTLTDKKHLLPNGHPIPKPTFC